MWLMAEVILIVFCRLNIRNSGSSSLVLADPTPPTFISPSQTNNNDEFHDLEMMCKHPSLSNTNPPTTTFDLPSQKNKNELFDKSQITYQIPSSLSITSPPTVTFIPPTTICISPTRKLISPPQIDDNSFDDLEIIHKNPSSTNTSHQIKISNSVIQFLQQVNFLISK